MYRNAFVTLIPLAFSALFADKPIDDFEKGTTKNFLNGDWYYFSDVKDGGNSVIKNAKLSSPGNYEAFKPDSGGYNSKYCAKLEYAFGDTLPRVEDGYGGVLGYCNFTGIGTDIARAGGVVDIRPAYGISFRARSADSITIFCELVTGNIYNYSYHRAYFHITDNWQYFKMDFNDTDFTFQPFSGGIPTTPKPELSKVQKINWQVAKCFMTNYSTMLCKSDSGCLSLDDVTLLDSTTVSIAYTPLSQKKQPVGTAIFNNLLGRRFSPANPGARPAGLYVMPEGKLLHVGTTARALTNSKQ